MSDRDLSRLTARFEIAVANFVRSTFDLAANEKAFQAWYAASVIQEFGLSRVTGKSTSGRPNFERWCPPR